MGHVLPSALADLALAMASACTIDDGSTNDDSSSNRDTDNDDIDGDTEEEAEDDDDQDDGKRKTTADHEAGRLTARAKAGFVAPAAPKSSNGSDEDNNNSVRGAPRTAVAPVPSHDVLQEEETLLFRMMGTVDPDTSYLNAGYRSLQAGQDSDLPEQEEEGRGDYVVADPTGKEVDRRGYPEGSAAGTSSYCKETRARLLLTSSLLPFVAAGGEERRRRRRYHRSVVFDVCSIDPGGVTTDYVS